jgi:erythromycin esterase-like protein
MFDATGMSRAIFNVKAITGGPAAADPLRRRLTIRSIGATFAPSVPASAYQAALALPEDYDLVIWFQVTTPSRLSFGTSGSLQLGMWPE